VAVRHEPERRQASASPGKEGRALETPRNEPRPTDDATAANAAARASAGAPANAGRPAPRAPFGGRALAFALVALAALLVTLWVEPRTSINPRALLPDMVAGTAHRPYVYRALVPILTRAAASVVPPSAQNALADLTARSAVLRDALRWESAHATWYLIVFLIHWGALTLFGLCMRDLARRALALGDGPALGAAVAAVLLVAIHFGYQNFVYDFPQLALFALGLALLRRGALAGWYALLPIGVLNKETFVLMSVVFALTQWRRYSSRSLAVHLTAQFTIAAAVLAAIHIACHGNPGTPVEFHLQRNLHYQPGARQLVHDAVYWGFWVTALWHWREKRALAGVALTLGVLLVGSTLFLGYLGEYRDYYEVYPVLFLMVAHTVMRVAAKQPVEDPWPV